jgi:hypothetical protein
MNPVDRVITENQIVKNFCEIFRNQTITAIEQSVKITKSKVIRDRVLFMIETADIPFAMIEKIAKALNMPKSDILQDYWKSDGVGFAIEVEKDLANYRIYFENSIRPHEVPELAEKNIRKKQTISSIKWDLHDPENYTNTNYYRIVNNVSIYDVGDAVEKSGFHFVPKFAKDALKKHRKMFLYETTDTNSSRKSFYIRMDDLYLNEVKQDVVAFSSEKIFDTLKVFEKFRVNYYAGGISKDKEKFINVYFLIYDKDVDE